MDYTNEREVPIKSESTPPDLLKYYTDPFTHDSLTSLRHLDARIEELKLMKTQSD